PCLQQRRGHIDELFQQSARVHRVDDVLDHEGFSATEWRAERADTLLDLGKFAGTILCRLKLGLVGDFEPAFDGQRPPLGGGPCISEVESPVTLVTTRRYAEGLAHNEGAPWDRGLGNRGQCADTVTHGSLLFGCQADLEAGYVDKIDDRKMEDFGEIQHAHELLGSLLIPSAAIVIRVAGEDHDRHTFYTGQAGDQRPAPTAADFHEGAAVHYGVQNGPHFVDGTIILWHHVSKPFEILRFRSYRLHTRWQLMDGPWKVAEE